VVPTAAQVQAAITMLDAWAQANLETSGAVGGSGGAVVTGNAGMVSTDTQNKVDVDVPELMNSLNGAALQQVSLFQASMNTIAMQSHNQALFYEGLMKQQACRAGGPLPPLELPPTGADALEEK